MAPPQQAFQPSELPSRIQITAEGKRRKKTVNLKKCDLLELTQYNCDTEQRGPKKKKFIVCEEVERLFRRCADGLTVETTSWEGQG